MALASSEAVLGCDDIQLRQLSAANTAAASCVSQVTCSECLPFTMTRVQNCLQRVYSAFHYDTCTELLTICIQC